MKIDLKVPILKLDGTEFEDKPTLQSVVVLALTTPIRSDESIDINSKLSSYRLACKLAINEEVDITAEDIVLIKERIGKVIQNVVVIGRVFDLLDV